MCMDMDKVQVSVCSRAAFGVRTLDSFMPLCVMPWPRRKCGLFKQCRLSSRLFRLGSLQLSQCVCVCVSVRCHISGLSPPHCLERTSQGDPRLPKTKFPRFLAAGLCVVSSCLPCDLDSPWHDAILPLLSPPTFLSGDVSSGSAKGVSPRTWFQF